MNIQPILLLLCLLVSTGVVRAQALQPKVIASTGTQVVSSNLQLAYTVGEMAVTTAAASSVILTQGFHQSYKNAVGVSFIQNPIDVQLYPNPTTNYVRLLVNGYTQPFTIRLYHLSGKLLLKQIYHPLNPLDINLSEYSAGIYFLQLTDTNGQSQGVYRIEKI